MKNIMSEMEWRISHSPQPYAQTVAAMEARVDAIRRGDAPEMVWLLEHPPLYTAGTSAKPEDLLRPGALPVHQTGRGGQYTYHGPGQIIAYVMLDLSRRGQDLRAYVNSLQLWVIAALAEFGVSGECRAGYPGVWVRRPGSAGLEEADKIAAIGVRVRRWVTFHGISLNVCPDLSHYAGIVPCGVTDGGVTSLEALGVQAATSQTLAALIRTFPTVCKDFFSSINCARYVD